MDLKEALGAREGATATRFALYLPDSDRRGDPVPDLERWKEAAMALFADVNGGATLLPPAQGIWKPDDGGATVREATSVVYSFIRNQERFERGLKRLAAFIHSFGKHAEQGEVMVEFSGEVPGRGFVARAYYIDEFPWAGERPF
ncbi:MAG TPA: hypothetical protein VF702_00495 [Allosphingosinicella sp.]|jgi:hypothetical protein